MTTWHDRMEFARMLRGMSPAKLARSVGVSAAAISEWRSKKINHLNAENAYALCDALNIRMPWLLYAKGKMSEDVDNTEKDRPVTDPIRTALDLLTLQAIDRLDHSQLNGLALELHRLSDYAGNRRIIMAHEVARQRIQESKETTP